MTEENSKRPNSGPGKGKKPPKDRAKGKPKQQTSIAKPANCESARIKVNDVKLRQLIILLSNGCTQKECAAQLGVTERTIRNWSNSPKMEELLADLSKEFDPAVEIGKLLMDFGADRASLLNNMDRAEEEGDHTAIIRYLNQLRHLTIHKVNILERLGLFRNFKFEPLSDQDRSARETDSFWDLY